MLGELLGLIKYPVTTFKKRAEERNIKKEAIITGVIAVVIALVTILTSYIGIVKKANAEYKSLDDYNESHYSKLTKEEFKERKKEEKSDLLEDAHLVKSFFTSLGVTVVGIALVAAILFIIARMVKSPIDYIVTFSMSNSAFIIYLLGFLLNTIFSYIYAPIGIILFLAALIFATLSLATAFNESMQVEDTNKIVIYSTIVLAVVVAILVIIVSVYLNSVMSSLSGFSDLFN